MVSSINSNQAAFRAQSAISLNSENITLSVSRLSSGNRIVKASDDVAGLSIGTSLRTSVSTLRVAKLNTSLGTSLLQVADGALAQVTEILQRQKAIATQAGSGSLGATERSYLNQEFQALSSEIDRLVSQTNFNGVQLLDGALSSQAALTNTSAQSSKSSATITFSSNPTDSQVATFLFGDTTQGAEAANNISLTFKTTASTTLQVQIGATRADTVANLATKLTALAADSTYAARLGQATYTAVGESLVITSRTGGSLGDIFRIDTSSTALSGQGFSGEFGGSGLNMFGVGFASATGDVTASTPTASTPFKTGSVIYGSIGARAPVSLYTLTATSSLTDIVNGINANTATHGVAATLVYDPTATSGQQYNIALKYNNSNEKIAVYSDGFYSDATDVVQTMNSGVTRFNMFRIVDADGTIAAATTTAALPINSDTDITARFNDGTAFTLVAAADITTSTTVGDLAGLINANATAITNGLRAVMLDSSGVVTTTSANARNIRLEYADGTNTGAGNSVTDGRKLVIYQQDSYKSVTDYTVDTQALNNSSGAYTVNLLASDISVTDTADVVTNTGSVPSGTAPFYQGSTISVRIDGTTVTTGALGATDDLLTIAAALNSAANTAGLYGFKAEVIGTSAASSAKNIQITYVPTSNAAKEIDPVVITSANASGLNTTGAVTYADLSSTYGFAQTQTSLDSVATTRTFGLRGGADDGIGIGSVTTTGTVGDALITGLAQTKARVLMSFPDIASDDLTSTSNFKTDGTVYMTVGQKKFSFVTTATTADQIEIGATLEETLDNAVSTINAYLANGNATGATEYELRQMQISRDGNSLVFEGKTLSNVTRINGYTPSNVSITNFSGGASTTNSGNLNNASNRTGGVFGVDMSNISNSAFTGSISGFTGSYKSANTADFSVKVGDYTYTASNVSTNPTSNTVVRFYSDELSDGSNGGFFDIQLAANQGANVAAQPAVDTLAARLNAAFSSLSFIQQRNISSYNGTQTLVADNAVIGSLLGSSVSAQLSDFDAKISDIKVTAPSGSITDAKIELTINGVKYLSAQGLSSKLGSNQTFRFTSEEDANNFVEFTTGSSSIDLSSAANALAFQNALKDAFGATNGSAALSFQVGTATDDALEVSIEDVSTDAIFQGQSLNVLTQAAALTAGEAIDQAIKTVTAVRADVGALQSRFNFAAANIDSTVQNQDAARGELLDTDIAAESTNFAVAQVKLQAGISTLAQANQQLQSLLKLIG